METIRDYFQEAANRAGSFNKLAAALKTTCGNITRIMSSAGFPGDETILRLADYLGENREKLLLINQAERAPEAARPEWQKVFKRFAGAAALLIVLSLTGSAFAAINPQAEETIKYTLPDVILGRRRLNSYLLIFKQLFADTLRGLFPREAYGVQN